MKKVAKKAAKKTVTKAAVKKTVAKKTVAKKTPAKKVPAAKPANEAPKKAVKKAAVKKAAEKPTSGTVVVANVDIGFGNTLYLRASAPGLSWSKGVPMDCLSANSWTIAMSGVVEAFEYKVLINDRHWSSGVNFIAKPGTKNACSPRF